MFSIGYVRRVGLQSQVGWVLSGFVSNFSAGNWAGWLVERHRGATVLERSVLRCGSKKEVASPPVSRSTRLT